MRREKQIQEDFLKCLSSLTDLGRTKNELKKIKKRRNREICTLCREHFNFDEEWDMEDLMILLTNSWDSLCIDCSNFLYDQKRFSMDKALLYIRDKIDNIKSLQKTTSDEAFLYIRNKINSIQSLQKTTNFDPGPGYSGVSPNYMILKELWPGVFTSKRLI